MYQELFSDHRSNSYFSQSINLLIDKQAEFIQFFNTSNWIEFNQITEQFIYQVQITININQKCLLFLHHLIIYKNHIGFQNANITFRSNQSLIFGQNDAFIDWEGNRQFHTFNKRKSLIKISRSRQNYISLLPKQSNQLAIEYNCSKQNEGIQQIDLILLNKHQRIILMIQMSQTRLVLGIINIVKTLIQPQMILRMRYSSITTCSSLVCIRKVLIQFQFTPTKQLLTLLLFLAVGSFLFSKNNIIQFSFSSTMRFHLLCLKIISIILSFISLYFQHYILSSLKLNKLF
ncbi:unnamed protein product [Paramecium octaurelia]|uniref:Transmembrane protein n=1 Tax=Paramecium octaurelia TaxID=43137 RepID=A0A8S1VP41_PAROT|nr:unnamed protein product [Paramecium octaurelia]